MEHSYTCNNCGFNKKWKGRPSSRQLIKKQHLKKCKGESCVKEKKRVTIDEIICSKYVKEYVRFMEKYGIDGEWLGNAWGRYLGFKKRAKIMKQLGRKGVFCDGQMNMITEHFTTTAGADDFIKHKCELLMLRYARVAFLKPEKIKIRPLLCPLTCFQNARFLSEVEGWEAVNGFNITACKCSSFIYFELHTVNRNDEGELIDYTRDFAEEGEKWFIPFHNQECRGEQLQGFLKVKSYTFNLLPRTSYSNGECCDRCGFTRTSDEFGDELENVKDIDKWVRDIEQKTSMRIMTCGE